MKTFLLILLVTLNVLAADTYITPKNKGSVQVKDIVTNRIYPANVVYTTDGAGNVVPVGSSTVNLGTITQGPAGVSPWLFNLSTIFGAAPSSTNYIPSRITDGTSYVIPLTDTQLRATPVPVSVSGVSTAANQTTANSSLSSIDGKLVTETYGIKTTSREYLHEVTRGNIAGAKTVRILGKTTSNVNATLVDVWDVGGVYVFPTSAIQMQVVSSSASDTNTAGTGIRTIEIHYLTDTYAEAVETIALNGTTPVNTVATNILRINEVHALTVGSGGVSAGNISVQSVGGGVTYSRISTGVNYARQAIYTVPVGKTLYLTAFHGNAYATAAGHSEEISLRATSSSDFQLTPGVFIFKETQATSDSGEYVNFSLPIKIPATADVKSSCISDGANNATCISYFEGWLE